MIKNVSRHRVKPDVDGINYHVMTKTAQGLFLLEQNDYRDVIYDIIRFYAEVYYVQIHAISVMSNHYHVVLRMGQPEFDEEEVRRRFELMQTRRAYKRKWSPVIAAKFHRRFCNLSKLMWDINRGVAWKHNREFGRSGHLWGARFKSVLVEGQEALLKVMSYVELNAVKAAMVEDPSDYRYASIGKASHPEWGNAGVHLPQVGFLTGLNVGRRWQTYRCWLKHLADSQLGKVKASDPCPELEHLLGNLDIEDVLADLYIGAAENWTQRAHGSEAFQAWAAKEGKKHEHELMLQRIAATKAASGLPQ